MSTNMNKDKNVMNTIIASFYSKLLAMCVYGLFVEIFGATSFFTLVIVVTLTVYIYFEILLSSNDISIIVFEPTTNDIKMEQHVSSPQQYVTSSSEKYIPPHKSDILQHQVNNTEKHVSSLKTISVSNKTKTKSNDVLTKQNVKNTKNVTTTRKCNLSFINFDENNNPTKPWRRNVNPSGGWLKNK